MNFNYSHSFNFYEAIDNIGNIIVSSNNYFYELGFENIFSLLSPDEKELLDRLYNYSKKINLGGFIDTRVWLSYLATSKIFLPPIREQFINNNEFEDTDIRLGRNGKTMNLHLDEEEFIDNELPKTKVSPLLDTYKTDNIKTNLLIEDKFYIVSKKTAYYNGERDFLLAFMNCLFSTRRKFYIKKCDLCQNYYVSNKSDTHYCRRISKYENEELSCNLIVAKMQKTYDYKNKFDKLNKDFLKMIRDMPEGIRDDYKKKYIRERNQKKKEYFQTQDLNILIDFINNYECANPFPNYDD